MSGGLVKVLVSDVRTAVPATPGVEAGRVTLQEESPPYRSLSIVIAQPEARAINAAWSHVVAPRPSTWDLFIAALDLLGARIVRVVVASVEEGRHFFAYVVIDRDGEQVELPARPSDALALALRASEAEILVAEQVFVDLGLAEPLPDN